MGGWGGGMGAGGWGGAESRGLTITSDRDTGELESLCVFSM